jgi:predicted Rossmann fold nucleotide-binding protein DprA/Smf involved in DNA uptake
VETPEDVLLALADRLKWENKFAVVGADPPNVPEPGTGQKEPVMLSGTKASDRLISGEELVIEELLKDEGPLSQNEILEFTGLEIARLPALLLQLELAKKVRKAQDGRYSLPG